MGHHVAEGRLTSGRPGSGQRGAATVLPANSDRDPGPDIEVMGVEGNRDWSGHSTWL